MQVTKAEQNKLFVAEVYFCIALDDLNGFNTS